jgi:uncharacterized phage protein (TIGR02218 family)
VSFDSVERSAESGRPVEVYTFSRGSIVWRFTSADRDVTVATQVYTAAVIRRSGIEQGPEVNRSGMKLTVPQDFPLATLYAIAPPSDTISLVLQQYHYGDNNAATIWQGRIVGVRFNGTAAEISLQPITSSMQRTGLRRIYQKQCPFALYGADCRLDPAAFRVTSTAAVVAGLNVSVTAAASQPDGYYEGGYLEWQVGTGVYERRFIFTHVGIVLGVDVEPLGLLAGTAVRIYPGCDHILATCNTKFSNAVNYGGMPYIPTKNPFGSDPVY